MKITEIKVTARHRRNPGDVSGLAKSIERVGLLHPPVVLPDGTLVAGARRVLALRSLGWTECPVTVASSLNAALDLLVAERDENVERLDFTMSEMVSLADDLEPMLRAEAAERQAKAGPATGRGAKRTGGAQFAPPIADTGKTRSKLAAAVGTSHATLAKAREVVEAAKADPELTPVVAEMDRSGNVSRALKTVRRKVAAGDESREVAMVSASRLGDVCVVVQADFRTFLQSAAFDVVVTDPPYPREFLHVFGELAACLAHREHVPTAILCGQSYLPEIMAAMCHHLTYRWTVAYLTPGGQAVQQWHAKVNAFWKPVLLFGPALDWFGDVSRSDVNDNDKRFHEWGQSVSGMVDLVGRVSKPGQTVCDPFCGGGTTAVACLLTGRKFAGCDRDDHAVKTTIERASGCLR